MNETVRQWMLKAEDDYRVARREHSAEDGPSFDASCFHAQQCVEKLMKAVLISNEVLAPRTHDLNVLGRLIAAAQPDWSWDEAELQLLTRAAVAYRYPGESAEAEDATEALNACTRIRENLLKLLDPRA